MLNVKRVLKVAALFLLISLIFIFIFSKKVNYSIIFGSGFLISVTGYVVMIMLIDRCLKQGKGQWLFFVVAFLKMAAITGGFYLASRVSKNAVLIYILGLSVIVLAIMSEALYKLFRSMFKWKNTN
jgi:hypothetical protein